GDAIATYADDAGNKLPYAPYTNVKFGMKTGAGSVVNANDWPLMRVEEMILIQAEGLAKSGNEAQARTVLENFVKGYRDSGYKSTSGGRSLEDEIWFQRRVELWMEGFSIADCRRLNKPIVRFHKGVDSNIPAAFRFNVAADDLWLNMRFPTTETDTNAGIVNNEGGSQPVAEQNGELLDGVTD
nr:RagB/SusD family nutrient uptake outer membrane protein [Bacteroidales bacterium]